MLPVLRRLVAAAGSVAVLLLVVLGGLHWFGATPRLPGAFELAATVGGPFRLTDEEGRRVTDESWRGRFVLLYFGYRYCPDICPTELAKMVEAFDALPPAQQARVIPAFVTVDPERDDPAALRDYTDLFHPALVGLTGSRAETDAAARAFRVFHQRVTDGRDADAYLLDHSSFTYLLGPDGRTRQVFPATTTAEAMASALSRLVGQADPERTMR